MPRGSSPDWLALLKAVAVTAGVAVLFGGYATLPMWVGWELAYAVTSVVVGGVILLGLGVVALVLYDAFRR